MNLVILNKGHVDVLLPAGRLDQVNGQLLKKEVERLLSQGKTKIHINFGQVEFINSGGLGALISTLKSINLQKGRLTLSNIQSYTEEIFKITQLHYIFEIYATEEDAVEAQAH
jgi:anti-sigma B factor antagonist